MTRTALLALALFAAGCAGAGADSSAPHANLAPAAATTALGHSKAHFLESYDSDRNGAVTTEEYVAARAAQFARTDSDHDGGVSEAEYVAEFEARLSEPTGERREGQLRQAHVRFGVLDADRSSVLTLDEFQATGRRVFARLDTNSDGVVDGGDAADAY